MIEGYSDAKSRTATWKCTPGVGSTTIPPLYFLPLITAVVLVEPFDSVISSYLGMIASKPMFSEEHAHDPSRDSLTGHVFDWQEADPRKSGDKFHHYFTVELG